VREHVDSLCQLSKKKGVLSKRELHLSIIGEKGENYICPILHYKKKKAGNCRLEIKTIKPSILS
jgi:hypothetical protein